jgi:nucleoid-associated protein YgaU
MMIAALFAGGCATNQSMTSAEQSAAAEARTGNMKPMPSSMSGSSSYNVVRGDHLWGIASKSSIYGNPYEWPLIFKANRDKIADADVIEPGQVLSIDKNPNKADVTAAVWHAKHRGAWQLGAAEKSDMEYLSGKSTLFGKK